MEFNLWNGFVDFATLHKPAGHPRALKTRCGVVASKVRAYFALPRLHRGPAFESFDYVYAAVVVAALLALAGWRA